MDTLERLESNVRSYSRSFPEVFERAKMSKLYTSSGKEYIDFFAGAGALNYGHNNDYIKERIIHYIENDGITHALDMFTNAKSEFFYTLENTVFKPLSLEYKIMSCGPTGANAVEAAVKLARKVTGRVGVFAFTGSFHGMTLGSLSLSSGKTVRRGAGTSLHDVTFVPHPSDFPYGDSLNFIEKMVTDEYSGVYTPAAIIIETVQAEGGVRPVQSEFLKRLSALCQRHSILLIVDDIQAGCGRTGPFFSFEHSGIKPDLVTLSKSISGYGLPMSLLLIKPEHDIFNPAEHNGTFRGNQLAFVGGKAALELREKLELETHTDSNGEYVRTFISNKVLPLDERLQLRGSGMINGIDFESFGDTTLSARIAKECFNQGLVIERAGRDDCVLKLMPALTIGRSELTTGLEIIEYSIKKNLPSKV